MSFIDSIKGSVMELAGKAVLAAKEYAPEITLVVGGVLVIGAGVLACKQTLKLDEVVSKGTDKMEEIEAAVKEEVELKDGSVYDEDCAKHDRIVTTISTAKNVVKLYALPVGMAVLGFALIVCGHKILRDRNTALLGAYASLATAYEAYRDRVRDEVGEERENDIYLAHSKQMVEITTNNPETGAEEVVLKEYDIPNKADCPLGNPWARVFNAAHTHKYDTHDNADQFYNTSWLKSCETEARLKLNAHGTLSINEVYDMLGFDRVPEGQVFGWVKGDVVDFGVFSSWTKPEFKTLWENDMQRTIVLNFNVGKEPITKFIKKVRPNDLEEMDPVALELWSQQNK